MNKYRVMLNGRNFHIDLGEGIAPHGFFTNRFVEARSENEAELKAVESIRKKEDIKGQIKKRRR